MYKIMSNFYGQISSKSTLEAAIESANAYKMNYPEEKFSVWFSRQKVYEA